MRFLTWFLLISLFSGLKAVPLLMSWTTSIKLFEDKDTSNITFVTPTTHQAIALDFHFKRGEFYFSDGLGRINRGWLRPINITKSPVVIVEVSLSDGLAVDWINDYLYWTDITKQSVEMATLDGLYRRTLFNSTDSVEKPRAIVIDPFEGLLFWSDWGSNARVESSGLDGNSKKRILSSDLYWPNGLALDLKNKKLFILDGFVSTISSCNYDGSNLKVLSRSQDNILQAFSLTFFDNHLYWSTWRTRTVFSLDINSGKTETIFTSTGWRGIIERMMGIKAVHSSLQEENSRNPCASAGCSHRCLIGQKRTTTCICPYGFKLSSDGKSCVEEGYLLISWRSTIRRYTLDGDNQEPLIDNVNAAISIAYHLHKELVFWSDIEENRIYRAPLGQLNNKTVIAMTENCDGLAVDWVHDVLYWTDTTQNTLEAASLDGKNHKLIFSQDLDEPRDIALDPQSGFMFWSDWGVNPKIERAVLDGSDRKAIISTNLAWPNGITIDFDEKRIYWVDGKLATISSSSYDGSQIKMLLQAHVTALQPFSISLYKDNIYWTDWRTQSLFKANKINATELTRLANSSTIQLRPNGIKVVHSSLQKQQENPCLSLQCKDLCLGNINPKSVHCLGESYPATTESVIEKAELQSKVFNDSIQLTLISSKIPSLIVITTKCIKRENCPEDKHCSEESKKLQVFNMQTSFNISDLLPATHYELDFQSGEHNEKLHLVTSVTEPPERPVLTSLDINGRNVTIKWNPVDICVPGFKSYHYTIFKTTVNDEEAIEGSTNNNEVTLINLEYEVNFTAHVYTQDPTHYSSITFYINKENAQECKKEEHLCDGKKDCSDASDENIDLCAGIESIIVYKKSKSEVYFRCEISNSTKKQLDKFIGKYSIAGSNETHTFEESPIPCAIWPKSFCFHIPSLKRDKVYNFEISVALKGGEVGKEFTVSTITKEGVSEPPENIQVSSNSPTSVLIQWSHPRQSNGIIRSFFINVHEVDTFDKDQCCQSLPIIEKPVNKEEPEYVIETGGLNPASTYSISVQPKTLYFGTPKAIDINTPPPHMDIMRPPNVSVSSDPPLSWQINENQDSEQPQYHSLIKSYALLLWKTKDTNQHTNIANTNLGPLKAILESEIGPGFLVLWHKNIEDAAAFQQSIEVTDLDHGQQYKLAWVQISQYEDAYGIDYIESDPFFAVKSNNII